MIMSTSSDICGACLVRPDRPGSAGTLRAMFLTLINALAEGKAASDHYQTLIARGAGPGEAARAVFLSHFA